MKYGMPADFESNLGKDISQSEIKEPIKEEKPNGNITDEKLPIEDKKPIEYAEPVKEVKETEPVKEVKEWNNDTVLSYINKDREKPLNSFDDIFKTNEVEKIIKEEVNPYADLMDEYDKAYYKFKKETGGRTRKEFDFLNQDLSKVSALDMSIRRVRKDTEMKLSDAEAKSYLETKLNIDLDSDEISMNDMIELNAFSKPYKDSIESDKEKFRTPLENILTEKKNSEVEMVKLENGNEMPKTEYDQFILDRSKYIESVKKGVDSVTSFDFSIDIDDNGEKRKMDFSYEPSKEDKHSMLSDAIDVDAMIKKRYQTKDGFNHKKLSRGLWWGEEGNQQKVIAAAMEKARAETIEEMIAFNNNENFRTRSVPKTKSTEEGYGSLTGADNQNGFGVKYSGFENPK